jgi:hypothetical protein
MKYMLVGVIDVSKPLALPSNFLSEGIDPAHRACSPVKATRMTVL